MNRIRELLKRVIENKQAQENKRKEEFKRRLKYGKPQGNTRPPMRMMTNDPAHHR